jgi:hypothetical protein
MARRQIAVRFTFRQPNTQASYGLAPRKAFWDSLRVQLNSAPRLGPSRLPEQDDDCDKLVRYNFGPSLERRLNGTSELPQRPSIFDQLSDKHPRLSVTVNWTSYESLTISALIGGAKVALDWIEGHREVFEEILVGLAAEALDDAVALPVSPYLTAGVDVRARRSRPVAHARLERSEKESGTKYPYTALIVKELAKVWTILLGLALLFLVAYNEYVDSRAERRDLATLRSSLIQQQEKLIEALAGVKPSVKAPESSSRNEPAEGLTQPVQDITPKSLSSPTK